MKKPLLSIIVPIYKIDTYLSFCIESLIRQVYENIEIILVDDGSPDKCPQICDKYADVDPRIKVIHKPNGGLVSARKAGLKIANGKYIGYVDGDDWIEPDMFSEMMLEAEENAADIVIAGFTKDIEENFTLEKNIIPQGNYSQKQISDTIIPRMVFDNMYYAPGIYTYVWNKIFRRDLLEKCQYAVPNDIFLGEDAACSYPAILMAKSISIINSYHYHYRQRADSMLKISSDTSKDINGIKRLFNHLKNIFSDSSHSETLLPQLHQYILYLLTSRTGGFFEKNGIISYYIYDNIIKGTNVLIYGAGTLGQHLYKKLTANNYCNIVGWTDPDYRELQKHGLPVESLEIVKNKDFDFLLIAIFNENISAGIKEKMIEYNIPAEKIFTINVKSIDTTKIFNNFAFNS